MFEDMEMFLAATSHLLKLALAIGGFAVFFYVIVELPLWLAGRAKIINKKSEKALIRQVSHICIMGVFLIIGFIVPLFMWILDWFPFGGFGYILAMIGSGLCITVSLFQSNAVEGSNELI